MSWFLYSLWHSVKPYVAGVCGQKDEGEKLHFAKFGHSEGDTELASFRSPGEDGPVPADREDDNDGGEFEKGHDITEWQAGWNVTNAIQGMFIVSLPYAVLHGGYWGIFALVFVAYICCHTGKILVACLYELDEQGQLVRVRDSYVAVARLCLGDRWGGKLVNVAQIIELLMTCILYVVLCGDLMIGSFPEGSVDQRSWMMIATMLLLPCAFLRNLHSVSLLSFWCTVAHIIINVVVLGYCLTRAGDWAWGKVQITVGRMFPVTMGIVVFSYTSQIFLPTLEGNMLDRSKFHCMLNWSHLAAAIFKGLFAYVGYLTWAEQTQEVITNNLPTQGFKVIVNLTLVIKALLSYPLPYFAAIHLLEDAFFAEGSRSCIGKDGDLRIWAVAMRVLLVIFITMMSISIPHFALLMGLIGSFTGTMLSFVWPCYFHMKLKWDTMEWYSISWEVFIMCIGLFCGIVGIYNSAAALIDAYHIPIPIVGPHVPSA